MILCLTSVGDEVQVVSDLSNELTMQAIMVILKTVGPVVAVAILCRGGHLCPDPFLGEHRIHEAEIQPHQPPPGL